MKISVVIPTFKRVPFLERVLKGLEAQIIAPNEVIVGVRADDLASISFLKNYSADAFDLVVNEVTEPGVIASMSRSVAITSGDIVCLLDDDAEPFPNWTIVIKDAFGIYPDIGAFCGRDLLQDYPEMRAQEPTTRKVGKFKWYGRIIGNHHLGCGGFQWVDLFKGCNVAIRGELIREIGFQVGLLGTGAQVHWELALSLAITQQNWKIGYDSRFCVIHHIAPRHDSDNIHRGGFSEEALYNMAFNEHWVVGNNAFPSQKFFHTLWSVLVGSILSPGIINYVRGRFLLGDKLAFRRMRIRHRAWRSATSSLRKSRQLES